MKELIQALCTCPKHFKWLIGIPFPFPSIESTHRILLANSFLIPSIIVTQHFFQLPLSLYSHCIESLPSFIQSHPSILLPTPTFLPRSPKYLLGTLSLCFVERQLGTNSEFLGIINDYKDKVVLDYLNLMSYFMLES